MKTSKLIDLAKDEIVALTGLDLDTISSVSKDGENWVIQADMIELRITPNTQDVLGIYEVVFDGNANLLSYRRTGRYRRSQLEIVHEE